MITIREVAARAGVSISTVSHVVNNTRFVRPETRAQVLAAMEDLDYTPNRLARSLRSKDMRTGIVGLVIPDTVNTFFADVSRGVEEACFENSYNVILCNSYDDPARENEHIDTLMRQQVDGIVLVSASQNPDPLDLITSRGRKVVAVAREFDETFLDRIDSVMVDTKEGGYRAVCHLLQLGHTRIGYISGPPPFRLGSKRFQGYRQAIMEAGIQLEPDLVIAGDFRSQGGYEAARELLQQNPRPTAIFSCNDMMAIGAYYAIHEAGLRVPEDISVMGFDDIDLASFSIPRLSTIAQPSYEMGLLAAETLIERIKIPDAPYRHHMLPISLIIRDSCRKWE